MKINISLLAIIFSVSPLFTVSSQTIDSNKIERVEKAVLEFKEKGYNGTVLIADGNGVVKTINTGYVDKSRRMPISGKTLFNVASIAKGFTALAVLQLSDKGLIGLNDSINKYLPNVPVQAAGITIHHLLVHQSGLPNNYASDGEQDMNSAIKKIFSSPLESKPGEKFLYSGNNYSLLAMIVEKASKTSWEDYVREKILSPLGLHSTIFWYQYHTTNYPKVLPKFKLKDKIRQRNYGYVGPTGIFSTAHDLLKLNRAFSDTTLLSSKSVELLNKGFINLGKEKPFDKNSYGYGVFVKSIGDQDIISLRGNEQGWGNAISYYFKDDGVSIIVLSNVDQLKDGRPPHIAISQEIITILEDR